MQITQPLADKILISEGNGWARQGIELATPRCQHSVPPELHAHSLIIADGRAEVRIRRGAVSRLMPGKRKKRDFADFIGWRERNPVRPP